MSLKEKLQELKNNLQEDVFRNRDYEFDAELENHPIVIKKFIDYIILIIIELAKTMEWDLAI